MTVDNLKITDREELENIINFSPAVVFLWKNIEGWPVEYVSENVRQFGYIPEDFYSKKLVFADIIHPDDFERVSLEVSEFSKEGCSEFVQEYRIITKKGEFKWLDDRTRIRRNQNGEITHFQGIVVDITDRKATEEELKKNEEFLQAIFDGMQDGLSILDNDLNIIRVNRWIQEKYDQEGGLIGKKCYETYQQKKEPCSWCPSLKTLSSGEKHTSVVPYPSENNPTGWIELTSFPLKQQGYEIIGVIEYVKDITQQVNANQKLKESEEKYREAYNRASLYKDLFAHDINNILQNVQSSSELILLYKNNPEKLSTIGELTNIIKEQVIRGNKLVANVRKITELDESEIIIHPLILVPMITEAIEFIQKSFQNREITIDFNPRDEDKTIRINGNNLVLDLIENLLFNAVRHNINPHVEIKLKLSRWLSEQKRYIKLEILDNGNGISDERKKIIFQREKATTGKGMGLGLSLVKKIIDNLHGKIWVEDRVKGDYLKGSNFVVLFPKAL